MKSLVALAVFFIAISLPAFGDSITWGPATTISGNSDVSVIGSLDRSYNFGASGVPSTTVNGVLFSPFEANNSSSVTVGNTVLATGGIPVIFGNNTVFGSSSSPFSGLTSSYQQLLESAAYSGYYDTLQLTLNGLHVGDSYLVELFVNDSRFAEAGRSVTISDGNSHSVDLAYNQNSEGSLGQYVTGTFTATTGSQTIVFTPFGGTYDLPAPILNAMELRRISSVAAPLPSAAWGALALLGGLGLVAGLRRGIRV